MINQCHPKNPSEQNQKDATATTQTTYSIRDIPVFCRAWKVGNLQILMKNFQKIIIEGTGEYWTCGQEHDPRNWNWKPWQHLEWLCRKRGLDDFAVREIFFEHLRRKLECECQVLYDERELRKEALKRQFGVDFESG